MNKKQTREQEEQRRAQGTKQDMELIELGHRDKQLNAPNEQKQN